MSKIQEKKLLLDSTDFNLSLQDIIQM